MGFSRDAPDRQDASQDFIEVGLAAMLGGIAGLVLGAMVGAAVSWLFLSSESWHSEPPTIVGVIGGAILGIVVGLVRATADPDGSAS
jgi:ABC-type uncharacterized transport system permease subunit